MNSLLRHVYNRQQHSGPTFAAGNGPRTTPCGSRYWYPTAAVALPSAAEGNNAACQPVVGPVPTVVEVEDINVCARALKVLMRSMQHLALQGVVRAAGSLTGRCWPPLRPVSLGDAPRVLAGELIHPVVSPALSLHSAGHNRRRRWLIWLRDPAIGVLSVAIIVEEPAQTGCSPGSWLPMQCPVRDVN